MQHTEPRYLINYRSAVTRNMHTTVALSKAAAIREARALQREGAKEVECFYFDRATHQAINVKV